MKHNIKTKLKYHKKTIALIIVIALIFCLLFIFNIDRLISFAVIAFCILTLMFFLIFDIIKQKNNQERIHIYTDKNNEFYVYFDTSINLKKQDQIKKQQVNEEKEWFITFLCVAMRETDIDLSSFKVYDLYEFGSPYIWASQVNKELEKRHQKYRFCMYGKKKKKIIELCDNERFTQLGSDAIICNADLTDIDEYFNLQHRPFEARAECSAEDLQKAKKLFEKLCHCASGGNEKTMELFHKYVDNPSEFAEHNNISHRYFEFEPGYGYITQHFYIEKWLEDLKCIDKYFQLCYFVWDILEECFHCSDLDAEILKDLYLVEKRYSCVAKNINWLTNIRKLPKIDFDKDKNNLKYFSIVRMQNYANKILKDYDYCLCNMSIHLNAEYCDTELLLLVILKCEDYENIKKELDDFQNKIGRKEILLFKVQEDNYIIDKYFKKLKQLDPLEDQENDNNQEEK